MRLRHGGTSQICAVILTIGGKDNSAATIVLTLCGGGARFALRRVSSYYRW